MDYLTQIKREIKFNRRVIYSTLLDREVTVDFYLPVKITSGCRVLFLNDGQDGELLHIAETLHKLCEKKKIKSLMIVAIHANENRLQEYGTAHHPDYLKRGSMAADYTNFIIKELRSFIENTFRTKLKAPQCSIAGFSLGGLSALDIAWNHPELFSKVGVFSGSLWWRKRDLKHGYKDSDRIMHSIIRKSKTKRKLKFWIQTGTLDETNDRNNNGVIDSIDDSLDLIKELKAKGYKNKEDICYVEVEGGEHNQFTWRKVFPEFLVWAFKK